MNYNVVNYMRYILLIFSLFSIDFVFGTHLIGGELTYRCLGGNQYEVKVVIYRDCSPTNVNSTGFDSNGVITVYNMNNNFYDDYEHGIAFEEFVVDEFTSDCLTLPPELCVEKGTYTRLITLPENQNGYQIVYQRCCRNEQVTNIQTPEDYGSSLVAYIPPSSAAECNSSPEFESYPPLALCVGSDVEIMQSAIDLDGDDLVYSFIAPFHGSSDFDPTGTYAPPYPQVEWETAYSDTYPMDSNPVLSIDSELGLITGTPSQEGFYVIGIKVEEFRDGVYLGEVIRDFRFLVIDCEIATSSVPIADVYCEGLTVSFENNSENAFEYAWDFGDETATEDISSEFEPSYTYPDSGFYQVSLISNPGTFCADTAEVTFSLFPDLFPLFITPDTDCSEDALYSFIGAGIVPDFADFSWDFGSNATNQFSNEMSPSNVVFVEDGIQSITFSVSYLDCEESYTSSMITGGIDIISLEISEEELCFPETSYFSVNALVPLSDLIFSWDFSDGQFSNVSNPTIQFLPGEYDVSLAVLNSVTGCESIFSEPSFVIVHPQPEAFFTASEVSGCAPLLLNFDNESIASENYNWFVNGASVSSETDLSLTFDEGQFEVTLQAISEYSCATDDFQTIEVESSPEISADFDVTYYCNDNLEIQITDYTDNATSLSWSYGDGVIDNGEFNHQYFAEGGYDILLTATNPSSCNLVDQANSSITVVYPPVVSFSLVPDEECLEGSVQFSNNSSISNLDAVDNWQWDYGDGVSNSIFEDSHTYFDEGVYSVDLQLETDLGCVGIFSSALEINFLQNPVPNFSFSIDTCSNSLTFENSSQYADDYFWNFGETQFSSEENPTIQIIPGSNLIVTLEVNNEFCSNSTSATIGYSIDDIYSAVNIPNVFSPNGDFKNDLMIVKGLRDCESAVIRIFNRWGNEVFYSIAPMEEPWDGLFNSEEIIEGTYFYILELGDFQIKGVVNLFR